MNRRQLLRASVVLSASAALPRLEAADSGSTAFGPSTVRELARALSAKSFEAPDEKLPDPLKNLNYDQYRSIRFLPDHAIWRGEKPSLLPASWSEGFAIGDLTSLFKIRSPSPGWLGFLTLIHSFDGPPR